MANNNGSLADLTALTVLFSGAKGSLQQPIPTEQSGSTLAVGYPWGSYPRGHIPFDTIGQVALPVAPSIDTDVPFSPQLIVPNGQDGVITAYSINFEGGGFVQASGTIIWRILRNGQPIRNFDRIVSERGNSVSPRLLNNIRVYSGDIITVVVNHVSDNVLNGQVIVSLLGYFYPQSR
jgi:hypothetical protein